MITCPSCGEENPERAKFCLNCASPLAAEPAPARMERKFATALFADLVGSTALAEQEDPEVVQSVVGRTFDRLSAEITRYGGHLEKFMGDAVLAVFGIPRAHEDDPERAVRAAFEMQAVLSELNRTFAAEGKPQLAMRIGLEAGEVLVDLHRATGPHDRMLTGDAVNTAARLQSAADPGHVVVGPGVYASVKDVIEMADLPPLTLKGKAEPVPAWDARAVIAKRRGERPSLGMEARLIGRDEELTVLKQTLQRVESEGRPALVTIIGPAGVGKSRLVSELGAYTGGLPSFYYWRTGRCLAYGNTSYSAFADAIKAQCEILDDDPGEVVQSKTDAVVEELFGDLEIAPAIRALVTAGDRAFSREDLFEAWRRFLERMAARYPLVLALEDIHWADEGLLDFIEHVADWAQGPIMVVALARPELFERRPTWGGGKRNAVSIYLDPLTPQEDATMVDELLPGAVPEDLRTMIVERAEGNPLYTEEIVRMLIDRGVLRATEASRWEVAASVDDVDVPRSIQGLIAARLDGLPDDEKLVLQDAAVVGRDFWLGSIVALSGLEPAAARDALGRLRVKELIVPHETSGFRGEPEFSFRHSLLRDGAYDSLPKQLRAEKHAGVAAWAAARAGERADEMAELIATHALEALRYREELGEAGPEHEEILRAAYRWTRAAGDRTVALWLLREAIDWYAEASRLAERADVPLAEQVSLARVHADAAFGTAPLEETILIDRRFLALAERAGDQHATGYALASLSHPVFSAGDDVEGMDLATSAIERLEPLGDSRELAFALRTLGWFRWRRGLADEAEPVLRRAIEIARRVDAPVILADATMDLGVALSMQGRREDCIETMEEAFELAKASRDFTVMSRAYVNYPATVLNWTSGFERARGITAEGVELARKAGAHERLAWLQGNLSDLISQELGPLDEAKEMAIECVELAETVGAIPLLTMRLSGLALILVERGETDEARGTLDRASEVLAAEPEPQAELFYRDVRGLLASQVGDHQEVVAQLVPAIEIARRYHTDSEPQLYPLLVRSLIAIEDRPAAESYRDLNEGARSPFGLMLGLVVEGLLASDPTEAVRLLTDAVRRLEELPSLPELGRALIDLAKAQARAGIDATPTLARAREVFTRSQAVGWLPCVDAAEAEFTGAGGGAPEPGA
jgi:class 3 adenylate cyclase/tetratricopeptide (TPR) repeat protein